MASEWVFDYIVKKKSTITDLSAVVTGLLLALNLPVALPWLSLIHIFVSCIWVYGYTGDVCNAMYAFFIRKYTKELCHAQEMCIRDRFRHHLRSFSRDR